MLTWVSARGYFSVYRLGSHVEVWRKNYHSYTLLHFLYKRYHKNTEGSTNNTTARCSAKFFPRCYIESNSSLLHHRNTMQRYNATESSSQRKFATCAKMIVKTTLPCRRVRNGFQFIQWGKGNYKNDPRWLVISYGRPLNLTAQIQRGMMWVSNLVISEDMRS